MTIQLIASISIAYIINTINLQQMAKSLRSKSKLQAKSVKRKGEFAKFVDARNQRIAEKLHQETLKQEAKKKEEKENEGKDKDASDATDAAAAAAMDVDAEKKEKKISTSGWRSSNSQRYKQDQLKKRVKKKVMKF